MKSRQLSALLLTSISDYSILLNTDEIKALELRNRYLKILKDTVKDFNGDVCRFLGEGTLSVFDSSVEAVNCAIALQTIFMNETDIPVKMGIHVGDVVRLENDVVGDALNIVSKIVACSIPGAILISDKVHDQIRSHREISSVFLDAYDVKGFDDTLILFAINNFDLIVPDAKQIKASIRDSRSETNIRKQVKTKWIKTMLIIVLIVLGVVASWKFFEKKSTVLAENSIAVLPFDNLSTDVDSEIFTDGITEDILTYLSKIKDLHVISRTSVMRYKNNKKSIPEIAKELGVVYILEGSIRKYGDKIRVTAQLIDARKDGHIWADNYDKTITDIFAIQSEVSHEIVDALQLNLTSEEQLGLTTIPTTNIEAYQYFLRGRQEADKRNTESIAKSIEFYEKAIKIDSNYAEAYAEIANSIFLQTYYGRADPAVAKERAEAYLLKAEELNDNLSRVFTVKGLLYNHSQQFEKAKMAFEKAILLSPNDVTARHQYATYFYYIKRYDKQLEQTEIAYKLDPLSFATASSYFTALTANEKYDEAERLIEDIEVNNTESDPFIINRLYMRLYMASPDYKKAITPLIYLANEDTNYYRFLGYSYSQLGDTINAYKVIDSIKKLDVTRLKNHRLAVVFAGLQENDSVYFYLDTIRNKSQLFNNPSLYYFDLIKNDARYKELLQAHGIE